MDASSSTTSSATTTTTVVALAAAEINALDGSGVHLILKIKISFPLAK